ncbi:hypothetical protein [Bremerella sp. P1]|uniref:hypothetical protein n=1 Tax=Bremerella sp. P1 TaxID=3026424 RepID=UPI0023680A02|nr:hypothetical protein [Bremerella sp. P1]WDI40794.1 hypothetical protein PSR63_20185 [Bremerella sp. P1]
MMKLKLQKRKGSASAIGVIFMVVILAIGVIAGAVALRDHLVQEFGDAAVALDHLDQSFYYLIQIDGDMDGNFDHSCTAEYIDPAPTLEDPGTEMNPQPPAGITFIDPSEAESPVAPPPAGTLP